MNITFTQDHQSVASGNEFYKAGDKATLAKGQTLIDMAVARAGWGPLAIDILATVNPDLPKRIDKTLDELTKVQLIKVAKDEGVDTAGKTKAQLIEALGEAE